METVSQNYTPAELANFGLRAGEHVQIHRTVQLFGAEHIVCGAHVRIDCFSVISARAPVIIGNHVHLAAHSQIFGAYGVKICDFAGISSRVTIYTATDDYSGGHLTNPTVPDEFRQVTTGEVILHPHVIVGSGSVIMPGVTLGRGAAVGALSFVHRSVPEFQIVHGNPAHKVGTRNAERLNERERQFLLQKGTAP